MSKVALVLLLAGAVFAQEADRRVQAASFARLLTDPDLGPVAEKALERMGTDAIPALIDTLSDVRSPARRPAARLLGKIGKDSKEARAALTRAADSRDALTSVAAAATLADLGDTSDKVVAGLARGLSHWDGQVRRDAAAGLKAAGKDAKSAAPQLLAALDDRDPRVRKHAAEALKGLGVAVVRRGTESASPIQRAAAVETLGRMGGARENLKRLAELLQDDSDRVKRAAADALARAGKDARDNEPVLKGLKQMLANRRAHPDLRQAAFQALDAIGPDGFDAVATLRVLMQDRKARVRAFAATALGSKGNDAAKAKTDLIVGLNDLSHLVRRASAFAVVKVAPEDADVKAMLQAGKDGKLLLHPDTAEAALR